MKINKKFLGIFLSLGMFLVFGVSANAMQNDVEYKDSCLTNIKDEQEGKKEVLDNDLVTLKYKYNKKDNVDEVNYYINIYFVFKNLLEKCGLYNKDNLKDKLLGNIFEFICSEEKNKDVEFDRIKLFFNSEDISKFKQELKSCGFKYLNITEEEFLEFKKDMKKFVELYLGFFCITWGINKSKKILEKGENDFINYYINETIRNHEVNVDNCKNKLKNNISKKYKKDLMNNIKSRELNIKNLKSLKQGLEGVNKKYDKLKKSKFYDDYAEFKLIALQNLDVLDDVRRKCDIFLKKIDGIELKDIENLNEDLVYIVNE